MELLIVVALLIVGVYFIIPKKKRNRTSANNAGIAKLPQPNWAKDIDFLALHIETAANFKNICKISITAVQSTNITHTQEWLIQPVGNIYDPGNSVINGMSAQTTLNAPRFKDVWPHVEAVIRGQLVLIYCEGDVFDGMQNEATIPTSFKVDELLPLLKTLWKGPKNYTLKSMCDHFSIQYARSSKTLADVTIHTIDNFGFSNLFELLECVEQRSFKAKKIA